MQHPKTVKLGEICNILSGFAFNSELFNEVNGMPLIRIRDVGKSQTETFYDGAYSHRYIITKGDMLIGMDGDFRIAEWRSKPALLNQRVCKLEPDSAQINARFLLHFLPKELKKIEDATSYATVKHLSVKGIQAIEIPLPDLGTQRHIAAVLDRADALRQKDRQLLAYYEALPQAVFLEMFGDPVRNEKGWEVRKIEDFAAKGKGSMRTGPFGSDLLHSEFVSEGVFVLGIDNVVSNQFEWAKTRFISFEKYQKLKKYRVYPGDVLISIMGTTGRTAVVPIDVPEAINSKHLAALTLNHDLVNSTFLACAFQFDRYVRYQLTSQSKGAIMDGLNLSIIKAIKMSLPPLILQNEFAETVARIEGQKAIAKQQLASSEALFQSLLHDYFGRNS